jgi:hypothetical protein
VLSRPFKRRRGVKADESALHTDEGKSTEAGAKLPGSHERSLVVDDRRVVSRVPSVGPAKGHSREVTRLLASSISMSRSGIASSIGFLEVYTVMGYLPWPL